MGSIVETRFLQIRKRLDNAGYHEAFDINSLSLVERLTLDVLQLKEQLGVELKNSNSYKTILDEVELGAGLFKGENLRLIRENSKLRVQVQQNEEQLAEKLQKNRTKLRDLETENADLKLLIKQFVERVRKQEHESLEKSRRLALLEERHLRVDVVITGESGDQSSKQVMQMDCTAPNMCQHCVRMRNCCSIKCEDTKCATSLDYAKVADSRIDALSQQNRYLKNAQLELAELIKSLKSGIQMRETELERLRTDLELCGYRSSGKEDRDVDDHTMQELQVALKSAQLQLRVLQRRNVQLEKKIQQSIFHPKDGTSLKKCFEDAGSSAITLDDDDFESFWGGLKITKKMQLLEKQLSRCIKEKIELKQALEGCEKQRDEKPVKEIHISSAKSVQSDIVFEDQQSDTGMETNVPLQNTSTRIIDTRARAVRSLQIADADGKRKQIGDSEKRAKGTSDITSNQTRLGRKQSDTRQPPRTGGTGFRFERSSSTNLKTLRKTSSSTIAKTKPKENHLRNGSSGSLDKHGQNGTRASLRSLDIQQSRQYSGTKSRERPISNGKAINGTGRTETAALKSSNTTHRHEEIKRSKSKEPLTDYKPIANNATGQRSASVPRRSSKDQQELLDYTDDTETDTPVYGRHKEHTEKELSERSNGKRESDALDRRSFTASQRQTKYRPPLNNKSSNLTKAAGMQNVHMGREHSLVVSATDTNKDLGNHGRDIMDAKKLSDKQVNLQGAPGGTHKPLKVKIIHGKSKTNLQGRTISSQALDRIPQEDDDLSFEELLSDEDNPTNFDKQTGGEVKARERVDKYREKARFEKQRSEYQDHPPASSPENDEDTFPGLKDTAVNEKQRTVHGNGFNSMGLENGKDNFEATFRNPNPRPTSSANIDYSKKRLNVHSGSQRIYQVSDDEFTPNYQTDGKSHRDNFDPDAPNHPNPRLEDRIPVRDEHKTTVDVSLRYEANDTRQKPAPNYGQFGNGKPDRYTHETSFQKKPSSQQNVSGTIYDMPDPDVQKSRSGGLHNQRDVPPSNTKYNPQQAAIDTYGAIGNNAITSVRQRPGERADTDVPPTSDTHGENQYFQRENVDNIPSVSSKFSSMLVEPEKQPSTSGGVTQVLNIRQIVHQDSEMSDKQMKDLEREVQRLKRALEEALDHGEQLQGSNQRIRMLLEQAEADSRRKENQLKATSIGRLVSNAPDHQNLVAELRRVQSREASLESEITNLRTTAKSLDRDKDEMRIELDRKDEQLSRLNAENRQLSERLTFLVQTVKKAELELSKSGESRHDLQREIDAYKRQIDNLRLDLKRRIDERDDAKKDLIRLTQSTSKSEFERRSISVELEKRSKESDELRRQVKVYIDEIRRIEELLAQKDEELRSLMESYDVLSKEKGALESQRLLTKRDFSFGPHDSGDEGMGMTTSTSKLLHQQSAIQAYEEEIRDLSDQIVKLEGQLRTSQDRENLLDRELTAARDLCSKLESSMDSLRYDIASAESTKHKLQAENEQLIANFESIQRQVQGDQEAHKKLEDIISKLREKDYEVQRELKSIVLERDNLQSQLNQLQNRSEQLKEETERYRMRCAELQNEVEKTRRLYHQEKLECEAALAELKRVQSHLNSSSTNFLVTSALGGGSSMMSPNYPSATSFIPGEISPVLPPNSPDAAPHETVMLSPEAVP